MCTPTRALTHIHAPPQVFDSRPYTHTQHLSYVVTWNKSNFARRVISWSSLDWAKSRWVPDLVLGTLFDVLVHLFYMYHLFVMSQYSVWPMVLAVAITMALLNNPKLAWSSRANMPDWVRKKVVDITED